MKKLMIILAGVFFAVSSAEVLAADKQYEFEILPAYSMPIGDKADMVEGSFRVNMQGGYNVNDKFTLGLEFGYNLSHPMKDSFMEALGTANGKTLVSNDADIKIYDISAFVKYHHEMGDYKPYVHFGFGFYHIKMNLDATYDLADYNLESTDNDWGMNLGVGVQKDITDSFFGLLEIRYHKIFDGDIMFIVPAVVCGYRF